VEPDRAVFRGKICCPHCEGTALRTEDRRWRRLRHENWGERRTVLELETRRFQCLGCNRFFCQRFPGIQPRRRASEPYRRSVYRKHYDGISRSQLSKREGISGFTVERWVLDFLQLSAGKRSTRSAQRIGVCFL
jgi:transposase